MTENQISLMPLGTGCQIIFKINICSSFTSFPTPVPFYDSTVLNNSDPLDENCPLPTTRRDIILLQNNWFSLHIFLTWREKTIATVSMLYKDTKTVKTLYIKYKIIFTLK